jgi:hypothetical protein
MASITITQVQLETGTSAGVPSSQYWSPNTGIEMSINPDNIIAVGYVFDTFQKHYISGIIQIFLFGIAFPIYSSDSYASIVAYMNP